jgi:hypothetical protein
VSKETRFLCKLLGLYCLVVGFVMVTTEQRTVQTVTSLMQDRALVFLLGVILLFAGLAMILVHDVWSGGPTPVIVTLIGWITLVKGLACLALAPAQIADFYLLQLRFGELYYVYVVITLVLGTYLTYGGFRGQIPTAARR